MKTKNVVSIVGAALLLFSATAVYAGSDQLRFGDDLAEGVYFEEELKQDTQTYTYDSRSAGDDVSQIEPVFFTESVVQPDGGLEYLGDLSIPSLQNAMSEGICLETFGKAHMVY